MLRAGTLNASIDHPLLTLKYRCWVRRATLTFGTGINPTPTWVTLSAPVMCDALPIKDDIYFLQTGIENTAQLTFHFANGTDIRVRDRLQLILSPTDYTLVGDPNAWFEVQQLLSPNELITYIRCIVKVIDAGAS